jgi:transcription elongation factor Elf1
MSNLYALVEIKIAGLSTHARPVDFTYDDKRQPISIKKIVTTCPKCSSFNEYEVDIKDNSEVLKVECSNCEKSDNPKISAIKVVNKIDTTKVKITESTESDFIDPVQAGLFHVEQV